MIEYTRKKAVTAGTPTADMPLVNFPDGEVYCILSVTDYDLAKNLIGKKVLYSQTYSEMLKQIDGNCSHPEDLLRVHTDFMIDAATSCANYIACKKSDLKLPEEKPVNDGWFGYFDADKPDVQTLVGQEVEFSNHPLHKVCSDNAPIGKLKEILSKSTSKRYAGHSALEFVEAYPPSHRIGENEAKWAFIRPIKQKPLKPVDENCLFKEVLYTGIETDNKPHKCLLVGMKKSLRKGSDLCSYNLLMRKIENNWGVQSVGYYARPSLVDIRSDSEIQILKRCPDVKYSDE